MTFLFLHLYLSFIVAINSEFGTCFSIPYKREINYQHLSLAKQRSPGLMINESSALRRTKGSHQLTALMVTVSSYNWKLSSLASISLPQGSCGYDNSLTVLVVG